MNAQWLLVKSRAPFFAKKQQNFNVSLPSLLFIEIQEFLGCKSQTLQL
jgi:hypothetical protein